MTVAATTNTVSYDGDSSTTEFPFTFPLFEDTDLVVTLTNTSTGTTTTLTINTDYTIEPTAGNDDYSEGGTVTTDDTYSSTYEITLTRILPYTQTTVYTEGDAFPAASHEAALDKLTMLAQQTKTDAAGLLLETLEEISGYDADEIQILGHTATGDWYWFSVSVASY